MNYSHLFECMMLICFGFSWPLNVVKAYKAKTTKGTSLAFILLIITGYVAGISAKLINNQINYVLAVYFINLAIVSLNILVYIRNKKIDKISKIKNLQLEKKDLIINTQKILENKKYTLSSEEAISPLLESQVSKEEQNAVLFIGDEVDKKIPCQELSQMFDFNFNLYNKSDAQLNLINIKNYYAQNLENLNPEGVIVHIGENDFELFNKNTNEFDHLYLDFIDYIKNQNKVSRIALVSVQNLNHNKQIAQMNAHIRAIADAQNCTFYNLENTKLWNPEATKASNDFAYSMGLRIKKPLKNVCEILYSWAYNKLLVQSNLNEKIS